MWKEIREREFGNLRPNLFSTRISKSRVSSIQLSNYKEIVSAHRGSVNSLQVDLTEGRYLIAGSSDATVAVYDIQRPTCYEGRGLIAKHHSLFVINKQHENGHKFAISSAIWYPIDTGLFVTGSYDHHINVWDTNTTQVVMNFKMPGKVYRNSMSSVARSHMLIAAGTEDVQVRLCDIASGAFAHTLSGHRDGVMSVEWSTSSEWVLVTGGCDGAIRFWDIRRAGCFRVLDQSHSQFGRRPPVLSRSTTTKIGILRNVGSLERNSDDNFDLKNKREQAHCPTCLFEGKMLNPRNKLRFLQKSSSGQSSSAKVRAPQRKLTSGNASKPHAIGRVSSQVKIAKQRSHPGMLSCHDRATAHYGVITGLNVTEDGMYLLSSGSDSRLRLWDIESGCNTLVNFETTRLQQSKPIQMAVSRDSTLAFVPCMTTAKVFDIWSGQTKCNLRGHYENVNCCWYNALYQELYTGGNDRQILVWSPSRLISDEVDEGKNGQAAADDQDNWSD
ncbi:hypothetical protein OROMI_031723 [Orobanche minor]